MKHTKIRGNTFFYQDLNGKKEEIILLVHGHPFNHSMWKYQYNTLSDFRLLLPDLKGYGKSDHQFDKIYIEEQALDLALFLDQLQVEKVHLIGLSMGGQIIVEFHRLFPQRVKSMIICASTPTAETTDSKNKRLLLAETIQQTGMLEYTQKDIHKYINLNLVGEGTEVYQHLFSMMAATSAQGAIASHKGRAERRDNYQHLKNIEVPSLVIAGEKDFFFRLKDVKAVADQIPAAQFEVIPGSGHLPNMEKPDIFNALLKEFYERI